VISSRTDCRVGGSSRPGPVEFALLPKSTNPTPSVVESVTTKHRDFGWLPMHAFARASGRLILLARLRHTTVALQPSQIAPPSTTPSSTQHLFFSGPGPLASMRGSEYAGFRWAGSAPYTLQFKFVPSLSHDSL
jgi:hypothetical protein